MPSPKSPPKSGLNWQNKISAPEPMPVTLPQLSRRSFLKRAALAGAGALAASSSYAGLFGKPRDRHTFALFSDAHIAADRQAVHAGVNMAGNFAGCVRELAQWPVKPAAIIVNGDLACSLGRPADYATFGVLANPLRALAPVHLTLGNHDDREHFWRAFPADAAQVKSVPNKQTAVFECSRVNWFLLDSLGETAHTPGRLGEAQLKWLAQELAARPAKPAIVVCHHPLDFTGLLGLQDSGALEQLLTDQTQVKAFVFGHTHNWNVSTHPSGFHLVNLPQTAYPFQPGCPSGWVLATIESAGAKLELRCLDPHHPDHGQIANLKWRPA
jgi:Icc protein